MTSQQGTAVETLRAQLHEANERINKLSADVHEKKSGYRHNQLEELRNLQVLIEVKYDLSSPFHAEFCTIALTYFECGTLLK